MCGKHFAFAYTMFSVIGGAIIYYIVMNIVLWLKLPSDDLKLFSAIVVAIFLAFPYLKSKYGRKGCPSMAEMLKLDNIHKTFNHGTINEKIALNGVNLTLNEGDFVTVIGGNGAGKSTTLNAIACMAN